MKKILVPTDFSKSAQAATETAVAIARKTNAGVTLLHVVDQPSSDSFNVEGEAFRYEAWEDKLFTMKLIERSRVQLTQAAEKITNAGVEVKTVLRLGNPYHGIQTVINASEVDLVVMGTEGHSKLETMIIGSNTEKVVRHAKCPVLTIHKCPTTINFGSIVYATSLMKEEDAFSRVVVQLQQLFNATLHIVWVNTPALFQPDTVVRQSMKEFVKRLNLKNVTINIFSDFSVEEGILHFAESMKADLITMATHGRKGFAHLLAGSIAEAVSNDSKRAVLTAVIE